MSEEWKIEKACSRRNAEKKTSNYEWKKETGSEKCRIIKYVQKIKKQEGVMNGKNQRNSKNCGQLNLKDEDEGLKLQGVVNARKQKNRNIKEEQRSNEKGAKTAGGLILREEENNSVKENQDNWKVRNTDKQKDNEIKKDEKMGKKDIKAKIQANLKQQKIVEREWKNMKDLKKKVEKLKIKERTKKLLKMSMNDLKLAGMGPKIVNMKDKEEKRWKSVMNKENKEAKEGNVKRKNKQNDMRKSDNDMDNEVEKLIMEIDGCVEKIKLEGDKTIQLRRKIRGRTQINKGIKTIVPECEEGQSMDYYNMMIIFVQMKKKFQKFQIIVQKDKKDRSRMFVQKVKKDRFRIFVQKDMPRIFVQKVIFRIFGQEVRFRIFVLDYKKFQNIVQKDRYQIFVLDNKLQIADVKDMQLLNRDCQVLDQDKIIELESQGIYIVKGLGEIAQMYQLGVNSKDRCVRFIPDNEEVRMSTQERILIYVFESEKCEIWLVIRPIQEEKIAKICWLKNCDIIYELVQLALILVEDKKLQMQLSEEEKRYQIIIIIKDELNLCQKRNGDSLIKF